MMPGQSARPALPEYAIERALYNEKFVEWHAAHPGEWVVLKGSEAPQFCAQEEEAYFCGARTYPDGVFFMRQLVLNPVPARVPCSVDVLDAVAT